MILWDILLNIEIPLFIMICLLLILVFSIKALIVWCKLTPEERKNLKEFEDWIDLL